jgi:hypothetical protein
MLEEGTVDAPLGASRELSAADSQLARGRLVEAGRQPGRRRPMLRFGRARTDAERLERVEEETVDALVGRSEVAGRGHRGGDAVGDFPVMKNRAPTCRPAHDVDIVNAEAVDIVSAAGRLVPPE